MLFRIEDEFGESLVSARGHQVSASDTEGVLERAVRDWRAGVSAWRPKSRGLRRRMQTACSGLRGAGGRGSLPGVDPGDADGGS